MILAALIAVMVVLIAVIELSADTDLFCSPCSTTS